MLPFFPGSLLNSSGGSVAQFYSHTPQRLDSQHAVAMTSTSEILSALGGVSNMLASVQDSVSVLNAKVDSLTEKVDSLSGRVQKIEEAEPKTKRRRVACTDPELSVRIVIIASIVS